MSGIPPSKITPAPSAAPQVKAPADKPSTKPVVAEFRDGHEVGTTTATISEHRNTGLKKPSEAFLRTRAWLSGNFRNVSFPKTVGVQYGRQQKGISDHRPIVCKINRQMGSSLRLMDWNTLADIHRFNNFRSIAGAEILAGQLSKGGISTEYFKPDSNNLFHFFSELGEYLKALTPDGNDLWLTKGMLNGFVNSDVKSAVRSITNSSERRQAREPIIQHMIHLIECENQGVNRPDWKPTALKAPGLLRDAMYLGDEMLILIQHCLEVRAGVEGHLLWKNRKTLLESNAELLKTLSSQDFLCLQECTEPEDFKRYFAGDEQNPRNVAMLKYKVSPSTDDHCVILYDEAKYDLLEDRNFAIEGKKPCIVAKFCEKGNPDKSFVVGSVHHPGGHGNHLNLIMNEVGALFEGVKPEDREFYVAGDYNHDEPFFKEHLKDAIFVSSTESTMGGPDFNNQDKSVDGVVAHPGAKIQDMAAISLPRAELVTTARLHIEPSDWPKSTPKSEHPLPA